MIIIQRRLGTRNSPDTLGKPARGTLFTIFVRQRTGPIKLAKRQQTPKGDPSEKHPACIARLAAIVNSLSPNDLLAHKASNPWVRVGHLFEAEALIIMDIMNIQNF